MFKKLNISEINVTNNSQLYPQIRIQTQTQNQFQKTKSRKELTRDILSGIVNPKIKSSSKTSLLDRSKSKEYSSLRSQITNTFINVNESKDRSNINNLSKSKEHIRNHGSPLPKIESVSKDVQKIKQDINNFEKEKDLIISSFNKKISCMKTLINNFKVSSSKLANYLIKKTPDVEAALKIFQNDKNILDSFIVSIVLLLLNLSNT